jgi:integrase/recombinase XerD
MAKHRPFDAGEADRPESLVRLMLDYLAELERRNYTAGTLVTRRRHLRLFAEWAAEREVRDPLHVTRAVIERYQRYLFHYRQANGEPLAINYQIQRVVPLQMLFRWAVRQHRVPANPASDLDHPRPIQKLPVALSPAQIEQILAQPDVGTPLGLRDRAMMEVLYATGIRRSELAHLRVEDVDANQGIVRVVQGKGQKDRMVPIGGRALHWVRRWLDEARPALALPDARALFVSARGIGIVPGDLTPLVGRYETLKDIRNAGQLGRMADALAHFDRDEAILAFFQSLPVDQGTTPHYPAYRYRFKHAGDDAERIALIDAYQHAYGHAGGHVLAHALAASVDQPAIKAWLVEQANAGNARVIGALNWSPMTIYATGLLAGVLDTGSSLARAQAATYLLDDRERGEAAMGIVEAELPKLEGDDLTVALDLLAGRANRTPREFYPRLYALLLPHLGGPSTPAIIGAFDRFGPKIVKPALSQLQALDPEKLDNRSKGDLQKLLKKLEK